MQNSSSGLFALVSYVPEPIRSFVEALRSTLPGEPSPQPHLTLLPPRQLRVSTSEASEWAHKVLQTFNAFLVDFRSVCTFSESRILYLDAHSAADSLFTVHQSLNSGPLFDEERYEFRPHLTLAGPIDTPEMISVRTRAEQAWSSFNGSKVFLVNDVVALRGIQNQEPAGISVAWSRLWTYSLKSNKLIEANASGASAT